MSYGVAHDKRNMENGPPTGCNLRKVGGTLEENAIIRPMIGTHRPD